MAIYNLIQIEQPDRLQSSTSPLNYRRCTQAISAAVGAMESRSVSFAGAIRSGDTRRKLLTLMQTDLMTLVESFLELGSLVKVTVTASRELCRADEVNAAVATALAGIMVVNGQQDKALSEK